MSNIQFVLGSGFCVLALLSSAQVLPKHPTLQQLAGYHIQQQKNWQVKQLPANSVTYKFSVNHPAVTQNMKKEAKTDFKLLPSVAALKLH